MNKSFPKTSWWRQQERLKRRTSTRLHDATHSHPQSRFRENPKSHISCFKQIHKTGQRLEGAPGRLIVWRPFKPIFFKYSFIFDVSAPGIWPAGWPALRVYNTLYIWAHITMTVCYGCLSSIKNQLIIRQKTPNLNPSFNFSCNWLLRFLMHV
jgi:hypothetical protein